MLPISCWDQFPETYPGHRIQLAKEITQGSEQLGVSFAGLGDEGGLGRHSSPRSAPSSTALDCRVVFVQPDKNAKMPQTDSPRQELKAATKHTTTTPNDFTRTRKLVGSIWRLEPVWLSICLRYKSSAVPFGSLQKESAGTVLCSSALNFRSSLTFSVCPRVRLVPPAFRNGCGGTGPPWVPGRWARGGRPAAPASRPPGPATAPNCAPASSRECLQTAMKLQVSVVLAHLGWFSTPCTRLKMQQTGRSHFPAWCTSTYY